MCVWIVDADQIDVGEQEFKLLYQNNLVKMFLNGEKQLGIMASKGLGKTFLLKCKRIKNQTNGIFCLPINSLLDIPENISLHNSMFKFMQDYTNWVSIWKLSISISLLKHYQDLFSKDYFERFGQNFIDIFKDKFLNSVCEIFNYLLSLERSNINNLFIEVPIIVQLLKNIRNAVHIYIDKVDQAFSKDLFTVFGDSLMSRGPRNASYWTYAQFALADALIVY